MRIPHTNISQPWHQREWSTLLWRWLMNQVVVRLEASQSQIGVTWKFGSSFADLDRSLDLNWSCLHTWIYWVSQCQEMVVQSSSRSTRQVCIHFHRRVYKVQPVSPDTCHHSNTSNSFCAAMETAPRAVTVSEKVWCEFDEQIASPINYNILTIQNCIYMSFVHQG